MKVEKEDLSKDSPISALVLYLEQVIQDRVPREKLSEFDLGKLVGQVQLLDMIKGLSK